LWDDIYIYIYTRLKQCSEFACDVLTNKGKIQSLIYTFQKFKNQSIELELIINEQSNIEDVQREKYFEKVKS
jgi:hypothetical protein